MLKNNVSLYQEMFRTSDGSRFNRISESWIRFIEKRRSGKIMALLPRGTLLDVGCGRGVFLGEMKRAGWQVLGTEVFSHADKIARSLDIPIRIGELKNLHLPHASFDVITLWHVLEHIRDLAILQDIYALLKKDGILVVAVPNSDSLQAKIFKKKWLHYHKLYHMHHFSAQSLSCLLIKNGFQPFAIKHFCFTYNIFGWLEGFVDLILQQEGILFGTLINAQSSKIGAKTAMLVYMLAACMVIPALCAVIVEQVAGRGGTVEIYVQKK